MILSHGRVFRGAQWCPPGVCPVIVRWTPVLLLSPGFCRLEPILCRSRQGSLRCYFDNYSQGQTAGLRVFASRVYLKSIGKNIMGKGLDNVRRLYLEGIAGGNAREAVEKYTGHRYTQHSTGVGDGAEGFLSFFEPFLERNPKREINIVRLFEDGPWVFCSAYQSLNDGAAKWVTMDMFYTDSEGLILEHWDTIAPYQESIVSGEDMVGGANEVDHSVDGEKSKSLVLEYTKQVLQERDTNKLDQFVSENMVQHSAGIGSGRAGLADWLDKEAGSYDMLFNIFAQGDFVVTYGKRHTSGEDSAVFDVYRVSNNHIVEHWQNPETIGPRDGWGNSGKF